MQISGKIWEIGDEVVISATFKKRSFVIEYSNNPMYVDYISMELVQDKCSMLDNFKVGDYVNVSFNLRGKKWVDNENNVRYFNSIQAWRIEKVSSGNDNSQSQQHIDDNIKVHDDEIDISSLETDISSLENDITCDEIDNNDKKNDILSSIIED